MPPGTQSDKIQSVVLARGVRRTAWGLLLVLGAALASGLWIWSRLEASLPLLDGEASLEGVAATVTVQRDSLGIPTIRGENLEDVVRAQGFVHAQDRFFQMDLLRRAAAGELAALLGPDLVDFDSGVRRHRFSGLAESRISQLSEKQRRLAQSYADGVNAGLQALGEIPYEYLALRVDPRPWRPSDCLLAVYAMYLQVGEPDGKYESTVGVIHDLYPRELAEFLAPWGTEWDAPLTGQTYSTPAVPGPEIYDLRDLGRGAAPQTRLNSFSPSVASGSNNWALAGALTAHGGAMLAGDPHLQLRVPGPFYRVRLIWPGTDGKPIDASGVSMPGAWGIVMGSNGYVAWSLTTTYADTTDLVQIEPAPENPNLYLTPQGPRPFDLIRETIEVRGDEPVVSEWKSTIWGPVFDQDYRERSRVLRWIAHEPDAADFTVLEIAETRGVESALEVAARSGAPLSNIVVADREGHIGWGILGRLPSRAGFDGRTPTPWADGSRRWVGLVPPAESPRLIDPQKGLLWTANNRVADGESLAQLGDGNYALGARARQIRDTLIEQKSPDEIAQLALQLDDRALFLERWRNLLLQVLNQADSARRPQFREAFRLLNETWTGRASVDSVAFRLTGGFRSEVASLAFGAILSEAQLADREFNYSRTRQWEGPLWKLVTERPIHLLNPQYENWEDLLDVAAEQLLAENGRRGPIATRTWGEHNKLSMRHPLSRAIPMAGRFLDMPSDPLPGGPDMPRIQSPNHGAAFRMVVAPGHEDSGILHMAGGQSGHPLSPFYRAGHEAWAKGELTPFLPGKTEHKLTFHPTNQPQ